MFKYNENATHCNETSVGAPPFFQAADQGFVAVIHVLLEHRAEVNKARDDGSTPLSMAVQNGRVEAAEALLHHGARLFQQKSIFLMSNIFRIFRISYL